MLKYLAVVFVSVFIAELGDKTQLATLLFAADRTVSPLWVFVAAASALVASTLLAVIAGHYLAELINPRWLATIAGVAFIAIGVWTIARA